MPLSPQQLEILKTRPEASRIVTALDLLRNPNRDAETSPVYYEPYGAKYLASDFDRDVQDRPSLYQVSKQQSQDVANLSSSANAATAEAIKYQAERAAAKERARWQAQSERNQEVALGIAGSSLGGKFKDRSNLDQYMLDSGYGPVGQGRQGVINAAKQWVQKKPYYLWGGGHGAKPPSIGTRVDCSGLVRGTFAAAGIKGSDWLNGTTYTQVKQGTRAPISKLLPGDLVFSNSLGHVAIYIGGGKMIEAQQTGTRVKISPIRSGMFGLHLNY